MSQMGFNIDYIKVFPETAERIRKNLKVNYEYRFEEALPTGFFARNISVHAIVGKNGSGKSTLLEILYRLVNNLSFVLLKDIPRNAADKLIYIFGLYAEMGWREGAKQGRLRCEDDRLYFECGELEESFEVDSRSVSRLFYQGNDYSKEYALMRSVADNFFYTLVMNYSLQSYVAADYLGEECKTRTSNRHRSYRVSDVWINSLFHKNDGYMCPININPYRDNGIINMNTETRLTRSRVAALLQYFKYRGEHLIQGYQLWDVVYTYNPYIVNEYFDSSWLLERYNKTSPPQNKTEEESREKNKEDDGQRLKMTLELFQLVLDSDRDNLAKTILESLGVDSSKREKKYLVTMLYLVCKVLNIGKKYPEYILQANNFEPYEVNDALEIQGKPSHLNLVTVLLAIVKEDLEKGSHVTLKVARAINFLNGYSKIKMLYRYGIVDEDTQGIRASELMDKVYNNNGPVYSLEELEYAVLPSIFKQDVYLQKETDEGGLLDGRIELSQLSSGERQFVFSVSSIIYHLTNLRSVKPNLPRYHCFNLIIDEVEICFHPEYQRTFLSKLLNLLDRLEFNHGPYINIILTTHSPFLLSDIPDKHILYMTDKDRPMGKTFGSNIYDLLNQQFFMDDTIGQFASGKINELIKVYRLENQRERKQQFLEQYKSFIQLADLVGDEYLHNALRQMIGSMAREYEVELPLSKEEALSQIKEHEDAIQVLSRRAGLQ